MIRWIVAPLLAVVLFGGSAFLDALEKTTEESLALAEASEEAPRTTASAAREVRSLPEVAELTKEQASAFRGLSEALQVSAARVSQFNDTLEQQADGLESLADAMGSVDNSVACVRDRLGLLLGASRSTPTALADVAEPLTSITESQEKSIRHLKSINRKLAALGVVAAAGGVEPPPPPEDAPPPQPGSPPRAIDC
jgi:hypothetical protein